MNTNNTPAEKIVFAYVNNKPVIEIAAEITKLNEEETLLLIKYLESLEPAGIPVNAVLNKEYADALKAHYKNIKGKYNWFKPVVQGTIIGAITFGIYMLVKDKFN